MADGKPTQVAGQRVADIVAAQIAAGKLKPGERIKQDELANELNVSRIPVRDALRMLEARGLVTLKANFGAKVVSHSFDDLDMFYRIRQLLEPMLLERSMPHLVPQDIGEMAATTNRLEATTDIDEFLQLNEHFNWLALRRHDAPVLAQIITRLWESMTVHRRSFAKLVMENAERRRAWIAERQLLFGAIERRDQRLAPEYLRVHIHGAHQAMLDHMQQAGELPV